MQHQLPHGNCLVLLPDRAPPRQHVRSRQHPSVHVIRDFPLHPSQVFARTEVHRHHVAAERVCCQQLEIAGTAPYCVDVGREGVARGGMMNDMPIMMTRWK